MTADWNWDGTIDLAISDPYNGRILTFYGKGDGTFAPPVTAALAGLPYGIASGDLNGDGNTDIVAADADRNQVAVLLGTGTGAFAKSTLPADTRVRAREPGDPLRRGQP